MFKFWRRKRAVVEPLSHSARVHLAKVLLDEQVKRAYYSTWM